jgi:hypothetical protein
MSSSQNEALAPVDPNTALATIPDYDPEGMENIDARDITLPELKVCQSGSPEKEDHTKVYIEGLQEGELFLSGLGQIIGKKPVTFIVASMEKYGEVRDEAGKFAGRIDFNDPRTEWVNGEKPEVAKTYEFFVLLLEQGTGAVVRMNNTKLRTAKSLINHFQQLGGLSKGVFQLDVVREPGAKGGKSFFNYRVSLKGRATPAQYAEAKKFAALVKSKVAAGEMVVDGEQVKSNDDIPF